MDYGHPLVFGVQVRSNDPAVAVETARTAHAHGFSFLSLDTASDIPDAASVPSTSDESDALELPNTADHAYDPWTLATYVAGATADMSVRVLADVDANPVLTARAAASLDLLSGGRAELLISSSSSALLSSKNPGFGEAPHSPSTTDSAHDGTELRDRLFEAITIFRGMWDAANTAPLQFVGDHFYVPGTQRGPAPAHQVGVWVTGISDDAVRCAEELADGWVVDAAGLRAAELDSLNTLSSLNTLDNISSSNERTSSSPSSSANVSKLAENLRKLAHTVDTHVVSQGRDPRELRRQVVVNPEDIPGLLERDLEAAAAAILALVESGFAEILFATEDATLLAWLGDNLRPTVSKELVETRATAGISAGVMKNIAIRARRVGAIDYDSMPAAVRDIAVEPGDATYSNYRDTYLRSGQPGVVLLPRNADEVAAATAWARTQNVPFSTRSGGHGFSGKSTNSGGIVLNLSRLRDITVLDPATGLVRIEPGAQWAEVAAELEPYRLAISSGDSGSVGVGGLATVGGIGFFAKDHGLTIDYIEALEIVTATGEHVRASAHENQELFWGMRGAGPNFGIVTAFEFRARPTGLLAHTQLAFQVTDLADFLFEYGRVVENTPNDTTLFLMAGPRRPGQPQIAQLYGVVNSDDEKTILSRLQPFVDIAPLVGQQVYLTSYAGAIGAPTTGPQHGQGEPIARSGSLAHLTREAAQDLARFVNSGVTGFFQIRTTGGAANAVPEDATAYTGRHNLFHILAMGGSRARLDSSWETIAEHFDGYYLNFETDVHPDRVQTAFSTDKWKRLVNLKREWDPENFFKDNFNIVP